MMEEARSDIEEEPILSNYYFNSILAHNSIESALANHLSWTLIDIFMGVLGEDEEIVRAMKDDLRATKERNPACINYVHCLLNFKGFLACQAHRVARKLWSQGRKVLALLIHNRVSEVFSKISIPEPKLDMGFLIGNKISILHNVTLGGIGKISGDRHPKIGDGDLIVVGTCILGNIKIGEGAKIGVGSVVLKEVPPRTTAAGNPARLVGGEQNPIKLDNNLSLTMDHTSHISEWSDYVIYIQIMLLFGFFYLDLFLGLLLCRYDENWSFFVCVLSENLGSPI
ncbi:hypothetical protein UlMin_026556 [Ulmus minor]